MVLTEPQTNCPNDEQLRLLAKGAMPLVQFDALCAHVESCDTCQIHLELIWEDEDGLITAIKSLTQDDLAKAQSELESESRAGLAKIVQDAEPLEGTNPFAGPALNPPCDLGAYEVQSLIARGGMGEVYQARHKRLGRPVALKVIRRHRLNDPVTHEYFLNEMANAGRMDHPNLVRAFDGWEVDGCLYLAFEHLEGKSLQQFFDQENRPTLEEVLNCLRGICAGLDHLHKQNLIHCDLKPSNVMRLPDGTIKLIDIGLAKSTGPMKSPHKPGAGTRGYRAPEAENSDSEIDQRSDLYSLGRLLEFMLNKLEAGGTSPSSTHLGKALGKITAKLTKTAPADRYQSVTQVINDLNEAASGKDRAKLPSGWALFGIPAIAILSVAAVTFWNSNREPGHQTLTEPGLKQKVDRIPMRMVTLSGGSFLMGAVENDPETASNELPRRKIEFAKPFRMGITEVTVEQYREFVNATGYKTEAELSGKGGWKSGLATSWGEQNPAYYWGNPGYSIADELPVTMVTYKDANAFCTWLSERDGLTYRLPTEAEWEYGCRAGTKGIHSFPIEARDSYAWSSFNIKSSLSPRPVGTRTPNPWGLVDTVGNVREWCLDWYSETAYQTPINDAPRGPSSGHLRVVRGACFIDMTKFLRSSHRGFLAPEQAINNQGFRVVATGD